MRADKITEAHEDASSAIAQKSLEDIQGEFDRLELEYGRVQERLSGLDLMLDNRGWQQLYGTDIDSNGPTLDQIKFASEQLQSLTAQNAHMKRGHLLRANYVWDGGIHYEGVKGGRGAGNLNITKYLEDAQNLREFFGAGARKKRSKSLYTDGHALWIGNDATKTLKALSFHKITGTLTNPEDESEIWALRIMRQVNSNVSDPLIEARWIFLDGFTEKRTGGLIPFEGNREKIDKQNRIFMRVSNPTTGWKWGTPDSLAAMAWIKLYREFLISGKRMSDAMAMLWAQYKPGSEAGGANASVRMGQPQGAGGVSTAGGEWNMFSTAGKSYDFDSGRALLAAGATSLEVSVVAIASDPGAAGSSYGSAQTLDLPGRMAIAAIRSEEAEFDESVLRWMGAKSPRAWFDTLLDGEALYRMLQAEGLFWGFGLRDGDEQKAAMDKIKGKPVSDPTPEGLMLMNNSRFPGTLSNDSQPTQTAAPDQGRSNGVGGNSTAVTRKDVVSK